MTGFLWKFFNGVSPAVERRFLTYRPKIVDTIPNIENHNRAFLPTFDNIRNFCVNFGVFRAIRGRERPMWWHEV